MATRKQTSSSQPILKLRFVIGVVAILALVIAGPMLIVWKQVYINATSMKMEKMSDSLSVLNREIATLKLACEHMSTTEKIERFARINLGLEYPLSNQIEIVELNGHKSINTNVFGNFISAFKRSVLKDRG